MSKHPPKPQPSRRPRRSKKRPQEAQFPEPPPGHMPRISLGIDGAGLSGQPGRVIDEAELVGRRVGMRLPRMIDCTRLDRDKFLAAVRRLQTAGKSYLAWRRKSSLGLAGGEFVFEATDAWAELVSLVQCAGLLGTHTLKGPGGDRRPRPGAGARVRQAGFPQSPNRWPIP